MTKQSKNDSPPEIVTSNLPADRPVGVLRRFALAVFGGDFSNFTKSILSRSITKYTKVKTAEIDARRDLIEAGTRYQRSEEEALIHTERYEQLPTILKGKRNLIADEVENENEQVRHDIKEARHERKMREIQMAEEAAEAERRKDAITESPDEFELEKQERHAERMRRRSEAEKTIRKYSENQDTEHDRATIQEKWNKVRVDYRKANAHKSEEEINEGLLKIDDDEKEELDQLN